MFVYGKNDGSSLQSGTKMKLSTPSYLWSTLVFFFFGSVFYSCGNRDYSNDAYEDELYETEDYASEADDIGSIIDYYAGHPNDPDLPEYIIGATDEVIEATNLREMVDVIDQGIEFALDEVENEPRYLFALGRAAYLIGYDIKSRKWLEEAAANGSAAANAYLGYISFYEDEDINEASQRLKDAISGGFQDEELEVVYAACNFDPMGSKFNRRSIINALYHKDWNFLQSDPETVPYIIKIHNTLWSNDILWIVDNPKILLELDAEVSQSSGSILERMAGTYAGNLSNAVQSDYIQDAKRLALMYNTNPIAFRRIYSGIKQYAKLQRQK